MPSNYDDEGFVAGSFDPIKIYDAPTVALSQMFEGESSFRSLRDTFMDPASLSPAERDSYVSRLKKSLGDNPLTNSVLDVALNPFVWFMFLTTPAGGNALKSGAKVFTGLGKTAVNEGSEYFKFVTGRYSFLSSLGLLNAHQYGAGTPLSTFLHSAQARFSQLTRQDMTDIQPMVSEVLANMSKKFGVTVRSLDPNDAPVATAMIDGEAISLKEYLKKFNTYAHIHMSGMNQNTVRRVATIAPNAKIQFRFDGKIRTYDIDPKNVEAFSKLEGSLLRSRMKMQAAIDAGDDALADRHRKSIIDIAKNRTKLLKNMGVAEDIDETVAIRMTPTRGEKLEFVPGESPLRVFTESREIQALDPNNLSGAWLRREGFMPLLDQSRAMMKARYVDLFGNREVFDRTGELVYDKGKLTRIFRSLSSDPAAKTAEEISNVLHKEFQGYVGGDGYKKIIEALQSKKMTLEQFQNLLVSVRKEADDLDNFMPRNVWSYVDNEAGNIVKRRTDSIKVSPKDRAASLSGRVNERSLEDPFIDSDDLKILEEDYKRRGLLNGRLDDAMERSRKFEIETSATAEANRVQVMNLDYNTSFSRYMKQTRNDLVLHIDDAYQDQFIRRLRETNDPAYLQMLEYAKPGARRGIETKLLGGLGEVGATRYRLLEVASNTIATDLDKVGRKGGERAREYIMGTLVNRMRGSMPMRDMMSEYATMMAMDMADAMAHSKAFQSIKKMGGYPAKFVESLERYGAMDLADAQGSNLGRGLTKVFYASHLGLNLGSAMLNLMQPLMYAATWMDPDVMVKAYGSALKQYFGYLRERVKLPLNADPLQVDQLRAKHFRLSNIATKDQPLGMDLLDIRATDFELMDSTAFAAEAALKARGKGSADFWLSEMPLKLFTHSELFNRTVTGEAMLGQMQKAGRLRGLEMKNGVHRVVGGKTEFADVEVAENVREMVQNTQFGSDLINSPDLFQRTGFGLPWVRQFFTFPVRTLTSWTDTTPMVNQGRRTWGLTGFETEGRFSAMAHDLMRMMGTSAIVYEVGKNAAGIDLSRGLAGQTLYESTIVGPFMLEPDSEAAYNIPLSPAFSTVRDAAQALMQDDVSLIGSMAPRFIPGGIAASRLLNALPRVAPPTGFLGGLQRESADWTAMNEQGQVPIYRADGSLLEYRSAPRTILGSLGFNSYMFKTDQELNSFLVKNRDAVVQERRKYLDAVLANDMGKASRIKAAFEKRFKRPLSVTKDQIDRAIQLREVPLKERMYQRISPEFRPQVRPYLVERLETLKSRTPEELDLSTAEKARVLPSTFESYDPYQFVTE